MDRATLEQRLGEHRFWHRIDLGDGVVTDGVAPLPSRRLILEAIRSLPLDGKRVLDVGCRDGLYSFEAERLGAREVIGIDNCVSRGAVEVLIPHLRSTVRMHELNVHDLRRETFGPFDVVIFAGVLYHLRYPFQALKVLADVVPAGGRLILETAILRAWERHSMLYCPTESEGPYEPTSVTFYNRRGLERTLASFGFAVDSVRFAYDVDASLLERREDWTFAARIAMQRVAPSFARTLFRSFLPDRGVFVCTRRPELQSGELTNYWNGTRAPSLTFDRWQRPGRERDE